MEEEEEEGEGEAEMFRSGQTADLAEVHAATVDAAAVQAGRVEATAAAALAAGEDSTTVPTRAQYMLRQDLTVALPGTVGLPGYLPAESTRPPTDADGSSESSSQIPDGLYRRPASRVRALGLSAEAGSPYSSPKQLRRGGSRSGSRLSSPANSLVASPVLHRTNDGRSVSSPNLLTVMPSPVRPAAAKLRTPSGLRRTGANAADTMNVHPPSPALRSLAWVVPEGQPSTEPAAAVPPASSEPAEVAAPSTSEAGRGPQREGGAAELL